MSPSQIVIHHTAVEKAEQLQDLDRQHANRGYHEGAGGQHIAYHWFIGSDGTVKQIRSVGERSMHTKNSDVNLSSIAIALAGNFTHKMPNERQLISLKTLIHELQEQYGITEVIGHREASATACPGEKLQQWIHQKYATGSYVSVSRYYTPVRGQEYYYRDTYEQDFKVNCHGDCLSTASSRRLDHSMAMKVAACPKTYPFGTKLHIDGVGEVECVDRGGAIISEEECRNRGGENCYDRIDLWAGIGTDAIDLIKSTKGGVRKAVVLEPSE